MGASSELHDEIMWLKQKNDVVILAHNYQVPEVQDVADYIGDSLGLARQAAKTVQKTILFCGVHFMAETAAIVAPGKRVLTPDPDAGCSLSDSITAEELREWKARHPRAVTVGYVNTTAAVKAELDYCCTSSNAVAIVESIPARREILFLPDMFLGAYVARRTRRKNIRIWAGECHVHAGIRPEDVEAKLASAAGRTEFLVHPECSCTTPILYGASAGDYDLRRTHILSTEGMMRRAARSHADTFVVATETGMLYRLRKQNPSKTFVPAADGAECQYMKMITPEKVRDSLAEGKHEVRVDAATARRARAAIDRMLAVG